MTFLYICMLIRNAIFPSTHLKFATTKQSMFYQQHLAVFFICCSSYVLCLHRFKITIVFLHFHKTHFHISFCLNETKKPNSVGLSLTTNIVFPHCNALVKPSDQRSFQGCDASGKQGSVSSVMPPLGQFVFSQ